MITTRDWAQWVEPEWDRVPGTMFSGKEHGDNVQIVTELEGPPTYRYRRLGIRRWFDWGLYRKIVKAKAILQLYGTARAPGRCKSP